MTFQLPPLRLQVSSLCGVPGWRAAHPKGYLLPEDVRRDAHYQVMAWRNRCLRACVAVLGAIAVVSLGAVAGLAMGWPGADVPHRWERPAVAAPAQSTPAASLPAVGSHAVVVSATGAEHPPAPIVVPAMAPTAPVAAAARVARTPVPAVAPAQGKVAAGPVPSKAPAVVSVPVAAAADWPVAAASASREAGDIAISDFFGVNTAVMLSSNGGQSVRTYRVGDALPSGEVILSIDTNQGSITTNRRTIKK